MQFGDGLTQGPDVLALEPCYDLLAIVHVLYCADTRFPIERLK